ncbi:predicted protein [Botrytis cinerea T4]|uniref:Uncharacterized protein n=1 Tax=Botryotinia fuckeliana (strain T4) TaxID=999810 RepID=G2XYT2_BOTF4|nr:predicted protein [Botrytis cinerea T4]
MYVKIVGEPEYKITIKQALTCRKMDQIGTSQSCHAGSQTGNGANITDKPSFRTCISVKIPMHYGTKKNMRF